jgi:hypothetical protein
MKYECYAYGNDEKTKLKFRGGTFITEFKHYWDSLNAKRGYSWDNNPWVWVIEFMRSGISMTTRNL